jgi:hypothetical protein
MNTESVAPTNVLEGNEEFVAFLHEHARKEKVPETCDKSWLANAWLKNRGVFANLFVTSTGKDFYVSDVNEFFKQAAESYKG